MNEIQYISNLLQLLGGIILTVGNIPQIIKILKTKSVKDFSITTLSMTAFGIGCMEIYAIYNFINGVATMFFITNTLAFIIALVMVGLYWIFRKK